MLLGLSLGSPHIRQARTTPRHPRFAKITSSRPPTIISQFLSGDMLIVALPGSSISGRLRDLPVDHHEGFAHVSQINIRSLAESPNAPGRGSVLKDRAGELGMG